MKKITLVFLFAFYLKGLSQQTIFATVANGDLYSLDVSHCASRLVGPTTHTFDNIAFTPDGRLWGLESGTLYQIDTTTANATLIGATGSIGVSLVGLNDSTLLTEDGMDLYTIKNTDASFTYIGNIGFQALGDLTWYDNDLYMTTSTDLIKIVMNASNTAITTVTAVNNPTNTIPSCSGAATTSFVGMYNAIIGFSGADAYKICQLDGSFTMFCPSLISGGFMGAASIRLPNQSPAPLSCQILTTDIKSFSKNKEMQASPNPASKDGILKIKLENKATGDITTKLINMQGVELYSTTEIANGKDFDLNLKDLHLSAGMYIIKVSSSNLNHNSVIVLE